LFLPFPLSVFASFGLEPPGVDGAVPVFPPPGVTPLGRLAGGGLERRSLVESGRFSLPVVQTFPLAEIAQAHRAGEDGHVRGKLVLVVGPGPGDTL